MEWRTDIEAAKDRKVDAGQVLADMGNEVYQVVTWDANTGYFRENTNFMALRNPPKRWKPINEL